MYYNFYYDFEKNQTIIFDDERGIIKESYHPYCYEITNEPTDIKSMLGDNVKQVKQTKEAKENVNKKYLATDIAVDFRVLIDKYYKIDRVAKNRIMFIDIEVSSIGGFPNMKTANQKITAIGTSMNGKRIIFVLDEDNRCTLKNSDIDKFVICSTEEDLLKAFVVYFYKISKVTIISGWNSFSFDLPYLIRRITNVLGAETTDKLSPIEIIKESILKFKNYVYEGYKIIGVGHLDYMLIYKKYCQNDRPSFALDYISNEELGEGKAKYNGSLDDLYAQDINQYILYNIQDLALLEKLEAKLHYIQIAISMCHKGYITYDDVYYQSKIIEGAILAHLKNNNMVSTNRQNSGGVKFEGAFVKDPIPKVYKWFYCVDLTSLYPSIMRNLNISAETKVCKVLSENKDTDHVIIEFANGKKVEITNNKFKEFIKEKKLLKSVSGVLYRSDKKGIFPTILEQWFSERVEYKKIMKQAKKEGNIHIQEEYDIKQYTIKILLNSFYGSTGLSVFRWYDRDNAESVTLTGKSVIQYSQSEANKLCSKITGIEKDYVLYADTDSVAANSMIRSEYGDITIEDYFNNLCDGINQELMDEKGKIFVFPKKSKLYYYDEVDKCIKLGNAQYVEKHKVRKKMYRIKASNDKVIEVTADHSLMVLENDVLVEKKPTHLKLHDRVIGINRESVQLDYKVLEIESIECLGYVDDYVYDIGMYDSPHTFFANDLLVHNSNYISADELIPANEKKDKQLCLNRTRTIAYYMTKHLNEKLKEYAYTVLNAEQCLLIFNNENICYSGIWAKKKKYAMNILDEEGYVKLKNGDTAASGFIMPDSMFGEFKYSESEVKYDDIAYKMKVKGLDTVKSDFPKAFKNILKTVLNGILNDLGQEELNKLLIDFRDDLDNYSLTEIAIPKGVHNIEKYYNDINFYNKGTPIHVKSAINYNRFLDKYGLSKKYRKIVSGDKLKFISLIHNPLEYETIAFKDDVIPDEMKMFIKKYIDINGIIESVLLNKLQNFWDILSWGQVTLEHNKLSNFF